MAREFRFFGARTPPCAFVPCALLGAALLGSGLLGCASEDQESKVPPGVAHRVAEDQTGPEALLEGIVVELEGCFYIESESAEQGLTIAVFPTHEIGQASGGEGFSFLGEDYSAGDPISLGGAMTGAMTATTMHELPAACDDDVQQWTVTPSTPAP